MATTARTKDRGLGKDKRGTSPSNSQTSSNNHSSSRAAASTTDHKEKASSEKNIPNYLKPTVSSRNEPLKLGNKKNITTGHHHQDNQKLLRRRSFDKPPSAASPRRRSLISPGPCHRTGSAPAPLAPRERKLPLRSSSLGKHTVSKTHKDVPTKTKSPSFVNKESSSCNNNNASSSSDHEANNKQEDKEDLAKELVNEEVVDNKEESETSVLVSKSETETEEDVRHDDVVETEDDEKINSCDISTCTSEDQNLIPESCIYDGQQTDEEELLNQVKEDRDTQQEDHQEEETGGDSTVPEEGEDHEKVDESTEDGDNKKVEDDKENGEETAREGRVVEEGEEAAKAVPESPLKDGQGRKESPSAAYYNDVIEETASKLLEKRKNKVRALVGAFETVIDYESAASSK